MSVTVDKVRTKKAFSEMAGESSPTRWAILSHEPGQIHQQRDSKQPTKTHFKLSRSGLTLCLYVKNASLEYTFQFFHRVDMEITLSLFIICYEVVRKCPVSNKDELSLLCMQTFHLCFCRVWFVQVQ